METKMNQEIKHIITARDKETGQVRQFIFEGNLSGDLIVSETTSQEKEEEKMCPNWCGHEDICSSPKHQRCEHMENGRSLCGFSCDKWKEETKQTHE